MNTKGDYMERKGEMTKRLLGESSKELKQKKPFDKITIKMITDGAGVIRPTFYNYFQDKYEVMEWLLEQDVFIGARELIHMNMQREAVKMIFRKLEAERQYYVRAFEVEGQNSFVEMLVHEVYSIIQTAFELHPIDMHGFEKSISKEVFMKFHAITMVNGIKIWILDKEYKISADEALDMYQFLMTHSFAELMGGKS